MCLAELPVDLVRQHILPLLDGRDRRALKAVNKAMQTLATYPSDASNAATLSGILGDALVGLVHVGHTHSRTPPLGSSDPSTRSTNEMTSTTTPLARWTCSELIDDVRHKLAANRTSVAARALADPGVLHTALDTVHAILEFPAAGVTTRIVVSAVAWAAKDVVRSEEERDMPSTFETCRIFVAYRDNLGRMDAYVTATYDSRETPGKVHTVSVVGDHGERHAFLIALVLCAWGTEPSWPPPTVKGHAMDATRWSQQQLPAIQDLCMRRFGPNVCYGPPLTAFPTLPPMFLAA